MKKKQLKSFQSIALPNSLGAMIGVFLYQVILALIGNGPFLSNLRAQIKEDFMMYVVVVLSTLLASYFCYRRHNIKDS